MNQRQSFPTPRVFYFMSTLQSVGIQNFISKLSSEHHSQPAPQSIRVTAIDGQAWFAMPDVAFALELSLRERRAEFPSLLTALISYLDDDEYVSTSTETWVNESGILHLLWSLDTREARAFRVWVIKDVLPELRRDWCNASCCPTPIPVTVLRHEPPLLDKAPLNVDRLTSIVA